MSYVILIRGPLGVGKSTIGAAVAEELQAHRISVDTVMRQHGLDQTDPEEGFIPADNVLETNKIILPEIQAQLSQKRSVVLDGCFYHKEQILDLEEKISEDVFTITLRAPIEVCIERDAGRKKSYGKDAATVVHAFVSRFNYGTVIDNSKQTVEQTVQEVLSLLPTP